MYETEQELLWVLIPEVRSEWLLEYRLANSTQKVDCVYNLEHHPLFLLGATAARTSRNLKKLSREAKKLG